MILITGKVIHGQKYGRALGFPTANLDRRDYARRGLKVRLGVYAGGVIVAEANGLQNNGGQPARRNLGEVGWPPLHRKMYVAAIVIGPLDKHHLPKLEAHLIGFKGNLYGKKIVITLGKFIRPFKKFSSEIELKAQIKKDIKNIKKLGK
jgi:riboflavin kinase/FMN adenylyltransferase